MTSLIKTNPDYHYRRNPTQKRRNEDLVRHALNYLLHSGPSPVTEILYSLHTSHGEVKKIVHDIISRGFAESILVDDLIVKSGGINGRPKTKVGKLYTLSGAVKRVLIITPLGREYVERMNDLELMLKWEQ